MGRYRSTGRILAFDDEHVYGYGPSSDKFRILYGDPGIEFRLFRSPHNPEVEVLAKNQKRMQASKIDAKTRVDWEKAIPVNVTAMVKAPGKLLLAGPPEIIPEKKLPKGYIQSKDKIPEDLEKKQKAWDGELGGKLVVVSTDDGQILNEIDLPAPPVFDGMALDDEGLTLSLLNGQVIHLKAKN